MEKGTIVVRYTGEFEEKVWGVDQFEWVKDGKPGSDHAPTKDTLDLLGFMIPLTPTVDPLTEVLVVGGYTIEDGIISKAVRDLTAQEKADVLAQNIKRIDYACRNHIDKQAHWTSGPMIWDKASGGKPKSKAIKEWSESCWVQYYTNKGMLEGGVDFNESMLIYPEAPYTIGEALQE